MSSPDTAPRVAGSRAAAPDCKAAKPHTHISFSSVVAASRNSERERSVIVKKSSSCSRWRSKYASP